MVRTDGRSFVRCTVTWLPNFLGWVDYLSYGAPPTRTLRARVELRYYNQRYTVTTFFRSPSSISNVGQSFILSHTGRYNNNSDLFVLPNSLTIHVFPKLKTSEAGQEGYFSSYRAGSIIMLMTWFESTCTPFACRNLDSQWFYLNALLKTIILGCQSPKLHLWKSRYYHL